METTMKDVLVRFCLLEDEIDTLKKLVQIAVNDVEKNAEVAAEVANDVSERFYFVDDKLKVLKDILEEVLEEESSQ